VCEKGTVTVTAGADKATYIWTYAKPECEMWAEGGSTLLGVTATPTRADKHALGDIFERVTYERTILQRILSGYRMKSPVGKRYSTCPSGYEKWVISSRIVCAVN
jgi:hypothetical protein